MGADERSTIWMELRGARTMIAELGATADAVGLVSKRTLEEAAAADVATKRSWLFNQAMFTMRRFAYAGTLAVAGLGAAAVAMGLSFNMSMENNTVALSQFLGGATSARKELDYLYHIAAVTPFQFSDVTAAARRFLAFGYTLKDTNKDLNIIGDTVAAFGGGSDNIQRMVLVFGQIQASGRLLGQDMLQLEQQGIPAVQILQKQLGLTGKQLSRIGDLAIPASVGIPALMRGMDEMFHGASARQAKTLAGQLSTLKDYASQLMGTLTLPLYNRFRDHIIPQVSKMVGDIERYAKGRKQISVSHIIGIADKDLGAGGMLSRGFNLLELYALSFTRILRTAVIPAVRLVGTAFAFGLYPWLLAFGKILQFASHHTTALKIVLIYLIAVFAAEKTILIAVWTWKKYNAIIDAVLATRGKTLNAIQKTQNALLLITKIRTKELTIWQALQERKMIKLARITYILTRANQILMKGYLRPAGATGFVKMTQLEKLLLRLRINTIALSKSVIGFVTAERLATAATWLFTESIFSIPIIGWILLAITLLGLLIWKWRTVWKEARLALDWINDHWKQLLVILNVTPFGPFLDGLILIIHYFKRLEGIAKTVWGYFARIGSIDKGHSKHGWFYRGNQQLWSGASGLLGLAGGGTVTSGGMFLTGEHGPEIVSLPVGASVTPNDQIGSANVGSPSIDTGGFLPVTTVIQVDGRTLAEHSTRHKLNRQARR
jgi:tape measure domain-containing protein